MGRSLRKATKGFKNRGRWDESFKDDQFQIPGKATKIRLYDEFDTVPSHWVEFYSKKKESTTGFFALCLNYDYEAGEKADNGCPYCEHCGDPTSYTYGLLIWRREQKNTLLVRPIRLTPKCTGDILNLTESAYPDEDYPEEWKSDDGEGPDATHPVFGFDITIKVVKKSDNTSYAVSFADGGKVALKKSELRAFKDAYEQTPFGELAMAAVESKKEVEKKLYDLGVIGQETASDDDDAPSKSSKKSANYNDYEDEEVPDEDDPVVDAPKKKGKSSKPSPKKQASLDDDDDDDEGEEKPRALPWTDDDDDDDDDDGESNTRSYADEDESDAPDEDDEE